MIEEEYLPQCLAIGISRAEFGELNIRKLRPYILADDIAFERKNQEMHIQGRYFFDAVSIAIGNALRGKGQPAQNYMDKPYDFKGIQNKREEYDRQMQEEERAKAQFIQFAEGIRRKLEG